MSLIILYLFMISSPKYDIVLDPGHGGTNRGALAYDGKTYEKTLTLNLALKIYNKLNKLGIKTKITRKDDRYLTLYKRTFFARKYKPKCFISLHFNASPLHNRQGIELYYPDKISGPDVNTLTYVNSIKDTVFNKNKSVRSLIVKSYVFSLKKKNSYNGSMVLAKRLSWKLLAKGFKVDSVKSGNYDILMGSGTKALLFEGGFIDNPADGKKILTDQYREELALSLTNSLKELCTSPN